MQKETRRWQRRRYDWKKNQINSNDDEENLQKLKIYPGNNERNQNQHESESTQLNLRMLNSLMEYRFIARICLEMLWSANGKQISYQQKVARVKDHAQNERLLLNSSDSSLTFSVI